MPQPRASQQTGFRIIAERMRTSLSRPRGIAARHGVFGSGDDHRWNKSRSAGPLFEDLLEVLSIAGNDSLNPCVDFQQYACYNYRKSFPKRLFFSNAPEERDILLRKFNNDAGRAVFTFFRSCLLAQWNSGNATHSAMQALLKAVYVGADMTALSVFILLAKLSLVYDVTTDPQIHSNLHGRFLGVTWGDTAEHVAGDNDLHLYLVAQPPNLCYSTHFRRHTRPASEAALEELTAAVNLNVTLRELIELSSRLCSVSGGHHLVSSNATFLGSLIPGVSSKRWKEIVEGLTNTQIAGPIVHSPLEVLKHRFSLLTDLSLQPVTTALVLIHAAVALTMEHVAMNEEPHYYDELCSVSTSDLTSLWMVSHILSFSARTEHNQVILSIFSSLVDTIVTEAEDMLVSNNSIPVRQLLRKLTLVLPYHVYPVDMTIPNLESNFFLNILLVRLHRLAYWNYVAPAGIPERVVKALSIWQLHSTKDYVVIPLAQYTKVALQSTMTLLPMALLGFVMADSIWSALFQAASVFHGGSDVFKCDARDGAHYAGADNYLRIVERPLRALRSSVRTLNTNGWHKKHIYTGQWRMSLSQIFYRLVMFCHYCDAPHRTVASLRGEVATFITRSADFLEAFDCPAREAQAEPPTKKC
ncbi:uncharacterized protein [Dermacentor albipictus]|uniref:uncharacterized protein n=1 Tax=Dermacentor albipictus TaxID=60249 RepID=UPI0031FBE50D